MEREFCIRYRVLVEGSTIILAEDQNEAQRLFDYGDWQRDEHEEFIEEPTICEIQDEYENELDEDDEDRDDGDEELSSEDEQEDTTQPDNSDRKQQRVEENGPYQPAEPTYSVCSGCGGRGEIEESCGYCYGTGKSERDPTRDEEEDCRHCGGTRVQDEKCRRCNGSGYI